MSDNTFVDPSEFACVDELTDEYAELLEANPLTDEELAELADTEVDDVIYIAPETSTLSELNFEEDVPL